MVSLPELEKSAMLLSETERAQPASHLLTSLSGVLREEDEGVAEALRRDIELENNPDSGITLEEFRTFFKG